MLVEGDRSKLQTLFPNLGAGVVIRKLVHDYITLVERKVAESRLLPDETRVDIDELFVLNDDSSPPSV